LVPVAASSEAAAPFSFRVDPLTRQRLVEALTLTVLASLKAKKLVSVFLVARYGTVVATGLFRGQSPSTNLFINQDMLGSRYGGRYGNCLDGFEVTRTVVGQRTVSVSLGRDIRLLRGLVDSAGFPSVVTAISAGAPQRGLVCGHQGSAECIAGSSIRFRG